MSPGARLSKSKLMAGLQCSKRLYLSMRQPELAAPADAATQAIFEQGHAVGIEAQKRFPGGVLIDAPHSDPDRAVAQTKAAIAGGALCLYEAAFIHDDVLVRVDILHRARADAPWRIVEVKSTSEAKAQHFQDAAIQAWVLRGAGLEVESTSILHLNTKHVHPDGGELFKRVDVSDRLGETTERIPELVRSLRQALAEPKPPAVDIGPHCSDPYGCEFEEHCWGAKDIPELSVFKLPKLPSKRKWELYRSGVVALSDPRLAGEKWNQAQAKMIEVSNSGVRSIDRKGIARELAQWRFPLHFLDFETIGWALPRYAGTRPYQQIPFQFSCHIQLEPGGHLLHREYLHDADSDPRERLATVLVDSIGPTGEVVAYNKAFEGTCLAGLAEVVPRFEKGLLGIRDRLVDPLPIVRAHVYDRGFQGSFSIKAVAPALLGARMSYDGMEVADGAEAQLAYARMIAKDARPAERARLRESMLEYCRKDTIAMVNLVEWLRNASTGQGSAH